MTLAFYQAGLVELWSVLLMRQNGTYANINYIVHRSDFSSSQKFTDTSEPGYQEED